MRDDFAKVKEILHARLSYAVSLATKDKSGEVNIAPVGSAFIASDNTFRMLRGPLKQSYKNLQENQEAVFLAANISLAKWMRFFLSGKFGASYGYRIYVRLKEEKEITDAEKQKVLKECFGFIAGLKGGRKIGSTLNKILVFEIIKIREIAPY